MKAIEIIDKYYPEDDRLRRLLLKHSSDVANKALDIVRRHPELGADALFVEEAAMLHDIGIRWTDAPGIFCHGKDPYVLHGIDGGKVLRSEGLPDFARVCERHTGTGITIEQIRSRNLPMPEADYCPETIEEQIVCYADKFFSKSHPDRVRSVEQTAKSLEKFGKEGLQKFWKWAEMFE
ncbi:MAG: HDIG domain-containing metalloprotein [Prevotella sp.]